MPAELQTNAYPLTTEDIRMFLRDTPEHNILHDDVVFEESDIQLAIRLTVNKWNAMTPMSNVTNPTDVPAYVLLCGVCGFLLKSEGIRQMQNQLQTQDGNVAPAGMDEKESIYFRWATHFQQEFKEFAQNIKVQQNLESIIGNCDGFGSGYKYVHRY